MRIHIPVIVAALALFTACDENLSKIAGPSPNLEPTFASIQRDIFETADSAGRVSCTGCQLARGGTSSHDWCLGFNLSRKFF